MSQYLLHNVIDGGLHTICLDLLRDWNGGQDPDFPASGTMQISKIMNNLRSFALVVLVSRWQGDRWFVALLEVYALFNVRS